MTLSREQSPAQAQSRLRLQVQARAEQLGDVLALARFALLPVLLLIAVILPLFASRPKALIAAELLAGLLALSGGAAIGARSFDLTRMLPARIRLGLRLAALAAFVLGSAWAVIPPVLMPLMSVDERFALVAVTFGVMALVPLLSPISSVSALFLAPMVIGNAAGALLVGGSSGFVLALASLGLGCLVAFGCHRLQRVALDGLLDRLAAAERGDMLDLLAAENTDASGAWFWCTNAALRLKDVSDRVAVLTGRSAHSLENKPVDRLFLGPTAAVALSDTADALIARMMERKPFQNQEVEHRSDEGKSTWLRLTGRPVFDRHGTFAGYRCVGWNVSALREAANRIAHLSSHDALTDLQGRESFAAVVARECRAAAAEGSLRALLVLDLDGFKDINGRFGQAGGDEVLKAVADRLKRASPRSASIARLGADEFAILYTPSNASSAEVFVRTLIAVLRLPYDIDGAELRVDVGFGLALAPEHAAEAEDLMRKADLALSRAQAEGKGSYRLFEPQFERALSLRRELETDIRLALVRGEFALHYQPLLDLAGGTIVGFEALIRWTSPTRGAVSPVDFIPAAEACGLIVAISRFVLLDACRAAAGWREPARIAVNISPQHLRNPDFMADVEMALKLSGLPPTRLEIEITEGVFLENAAAAVANLHALRARGIRVALDDFGTGYSSLNYLTNFPVDKIKIDRSFITHFLDRHENRAIVDVILTLARKLGLHVTAEGVETVEQALALKLRRCDDIQGWLVSKAQPADAVDAMFTTVPKALRARVPALFESPLAAAVAMRKSTAA